MKKQKVEGEKKKKKLVPNNYNLISLLKLRHILICN